MKRNEDDKQRQYIEFYASTKSYINCKVDLKYLFISFSKDV